MQGPVEIAFHNMEPMEWAEQHIRARIADLERIFDRMASCRVRVDKRAKPNGTSIPPVVHIEIGIPGRADLIVSHEPEYLQRKFQRPDLQKAINEAFRIAERQLVELKNQRHGRTKAPLHDTPNRAPRTGRRDATGAGFRLPRDLGGHAALLPPQQRPRRRL